MRQMIKTAAMAAMCVSLLGGASAMAAAGAKAEQRSEMAATRVVEPIRKALATLTLTDDQKAKTDQILADADAQAKAIADDAKSSAPKGDKSARQDARQDAMKKERELQTKTRDDVLAALTDEQKPEFRKAFADARTSMQAERKANATSRPAK